MLEEDLGLGCSQCGLNGELSLESYYIYSLIMMVITALFVTSFVRLRMPWLATVFKTNVLKYL